MSGLDTRPILLATDGSPATACARTAAVDLCVRSGAALHIVHAWGVQDSFRVVTRQADEELRARLRGDAEATLEHEAAVSEADGATRVVRHLLHDAPGAAIIATAHQVDPALVVVGSHGRGALARAVLGTVSEHVLRESAHPVLVVHPSIAWPPRRVLVVVEDGSPRRAADVGAALAAILGVDVMLLEPRDGDALADAGADARLEERAAALAAAHGCRVAHVPVHGDAGETLARVLGTPALVVLERGARPGRPGGVPMALLRGLHALPYVVVTPAHRAWVPADASPAVEVVG